MENEGWQIANLEFVICRHSFSLPPLLIELTPDDYGLYVIQRGLAQASLPSSWLIRT
jgi:hypothetical protein